MNNDCPGKILTIWPIMTSVIFYNSWDISNLQRYFGSLGFFCDIKHQSQNPKKANSSIYEGRSYGGKVWR